MAYRVATKFTGVFERTSQKRMFKGKPDICYDICYRVEGTLRWEKVGWLSEGYSAKLAEGIRGDRMRDMRHGEELPKDKKKAPLFKDVAKKYILWAKENKKSWKDDESRYVHHLSPEFDEKRLDEISPFDIEKFKSRSAKGGRVQRDDKKTEDAGLSPATVTQLLSLIRAIYNKATSWGLYAGPNPIREVKMPTVKNSRERFLSYQEADALLRELQRASRTTHDIALLSLHCGLRAGEIFTLKGENIDFENGIINVVDPKNNERRAAYMTDMIKEMLLRRKPELRQDNVFTDRRHGEEIKQISQAFKKAVGRLNFNQGVTDRRQKVIFHTLRHTFASWLALQGESLLTIAELLGHKSLAMVKRYAHLSGGEKKQAALRLEQAFNQKNEKSEGEKI